MGVLVDTNVLLRRTQPSHPNHDAAVESVARLIADGETVCFAPQNVAEFWNVVTRPIGSNGMVLSAAFALGEVEKIERFLTLLPDTPAVYGEWRRLVVHHAVLGVKVHDARLVATMNVHGIRRLLTFDAGDFVRYPIDVLLPSGLVGVIGAPPLT